MASLFRQHRIRYWNRWLHRRIPPSQEILLTQRSIFILPSRLGVGVFVLAFAIYLLGTNYENNLIQMVSYLMASLLFTAILHSFRNLSGITVQAMPCEEGRVGRTILFPVKLTAQGPREALQLKFAGQESSVYVQLKTQPEVVMVPCLASQRGWLQPGRLTIESRYPLGLVRSWTHLDLQQSALIYPKSLTSSYRLTGQPSQIDSGEAALNQVGLDQFSHLKEYQRGESLRQVAWKQVAQGRGMLSKSFIEEHEDANWLTFQSVGSADLESRLGKLTFAVESLAGSGRVFGLSVDGESIYPGQGMPHTKRCMRKLALFGTVEHEAKR